MTCILALETATDACSVALYRNGDIQERFEPGARRQTERILPLVDELFNACESTYKEPVDFEDAVQTEVQTLMAAKSRLAKLRGCVLSTGPTGNISFGKKSRYIEH